MLKQGEFLPSKLTPIPLFLSGAAFVGDLYQRIALGKVRIRPEVKEFKPGTKTIVFKDGSIFKNIHEEVQ